MSSKAAAAEPTAKGSSNFAASSNLVCFSKSFWQRRAWYKSAFVFFSAGFAANPNLPSASQSSQCHLFQGDQFAGGVALVFQEQLTGMVLQEQQVQGLSWSSWRSSRSWNASTPPTATTTRRLNLSTATCTPTTMSITLFGFVRFSCSWSRGTKRLIERTHVDLLLHFNDLNLHLQ